MNNFIQYRSRDEKNGKRIFAGIQFCGLVATFIIEINIKNIYTFHLVMDQIILDKGSLFCGYSRHS